MAKVRPQSKPPEKPDIKCTRHECGSGLHSFSPPRSKKNVILGAACRGCKVEPVDWGIARSMDLNAFSALVPQLRKEWIRNHFFTVEMHQRAKNYALRAGRTELAERFRHFLSGKFAVPDEFPDFVPVHGDALHASPLNYARHATACCCRRCFGYWYGVPRDRPLESKELDFAAGLCLAYVDLRVPELADEGRAIPPLRAA